MNRSRRRRGHFARRGSMRLYRTLLWLYPPSLRRAHGDEMLQLFRDTLRDEIARRGPPGMLRVWSATVADLVTSLPREWPRELHHMRSRSRRAAIVRHTRGYGQVAPAGAIWGRGGPRLTMNDKFEKFTERARKVMSLAQEEAQRFNHNYIGTEHILLGLVREGDGVAAKVLMSLGVELHKVRDAVEFIIGRGDRVVLGDIGLTPRSKRVIELAIDEARRLNHHYIGTEHLLLGLVREGEGIAAGVLESLGVNLERVRRATIEVLSQSGTGATGNGWSAQGRRPHAELGVFSPRARQIIANAIYEARERHQREVGTGHALLALLADEEGTPAQILREAGVDLDRTRREIEQALGPRPAPGEQPAKGPVELDSHMLRAIALAPDEAGRMNERDVGPEPLLFAIIREGEGLGGQILLAQAPDLSQLRLFGIQRHSLTATPRERRPTLGMLTLLCQDVETTSQFYIQNFAAETISGAIIEDATIPVLRLPDGGPTLELRQAPAPTAAAVVNSVELNIWVGDVALIWRTLQDNAVAGVTTMAETQRGRSFTVPDPDGRIVRIYAQAVS